MSIEMTEEHKNQIDAMSHYELCEFWRFSKSGDPLLNGKTGTYLKKRLFGYFGGFTPEISKQLGWGR